MLYTNDNDGTMATQAKACINVNGNPERIAAARKWKGAVKDRFVALVESMKADSLAEFKAAFNMRQGH